MLYSCCTVRRVVTRLVGTLKVIYVRDKTAYVQSPNSCLEQITVRT